MKHHHHIVYGGRIGNLASQLEPRVRFFSENLTTQKHLVKFGLAISVNGKDITDRAEVIQLQTEFGIAIRVTVSIRFENLADKNIEAKLFQPALRVPHEPNSPFIFGSLKINERETKYYEFRLSDGRTKLLRTEEVQRLLPGSILDMSVSTILPPVRPSELKFPMAVRIFSESIPEEYPFTVVVETEPSPTQHQSDKELSVPHVDVSE